MALAFAPGHAGLSLGQPAVAACSLTLLGTYLAICDRPLLAGLLLGVAAGLKPQVGALGFVFAAVVRRPRVCIAGLVTLSILWGVGIVRLRYISPDWYAEWRANIAGMPTLSYDLANPFRFEPINLEVLLQWLIADSNTRRLVAPALVAIPFGWWFARMFLNRRAVDTMLSCGALFALGLIPVYHRPYDAIVLLVLCAWAVRHVAQRRYRGALPLLAVLAVFLVPGTAIFNDAAAAGRITPSFTQSWVWHLVVMPHQVWAICLAAGLALWELSRK
jgi:hypothetical protein